VIGLPTEAQEVFEEQVVYPAGLVLLHHTHPIVAYTPEVHCPQPVGSAQDGGQV